jgi:hypothetical protein
MIPGWGQVYNRKYWKVPLIYGGLGLLGAAIVFNQGYYSAIFGAGQNKQNGWHTPKGSPLYKPYIRIPGRVCQLYKNIDYQSLAERI